jgi:hypothetical protein
MSDACATLTRLRTGPYRFPHTSHCFFARMHALPLKLHAISHPSIDRAETCPLLRATFFISLAWFVDKPPSTSLRTCSIIRAPPARCRLSEQSEYQPSLSHLSVECVVECVDKKGGVIVDKSLEEGHTPPAHGDVVVVVDVRLVHVVASNPKP